MKAKKGYRIITSDCTTLAKVFQLSSPPATFRGEFNAQLISAAPDLYEALESLWTDIQRYGIGHEGSELLEIMSDARAALKKANPGGFPE